MTGLERVRQLVRLLATTVDEDALEPAQTEANYIIDAHLKEDAERDRALRAAQEAALLRPSREQAVITELEDEIDTLHEENENVKRWFREAEEHRDYWKNRERKRTAALKAELATLREVRDQMFEKNALQRKRHEDDQAELATLREDWEDQNDRLVETQVERDRLREVNSKMNGLNSGLLARNVRLSTAMKDRLSYTGEAPVTIIDKCLDALKGDDDATE